MRPHFHFGSASASTSALTPTADPRFHEIIRPTSAGPAPSPPFQSPSLNIAQPPVAPPHRVLGSIISASVDPISLDLVPHLVVSPRQDSPSMAASTAVKIEPNGAQLPAPAAQVVGPITLDLKVFLSPREVHKLMADPVWRQDNAISTPAGIQSPDSQLWEQAFNKLSERDRAALAFPNTSTVGSLELILEATRKRRDVCSASGLKFTLGGREIIVRDVANKVLTWVDMFKGIGDIALQYDSGHTALPWAGVRLLLQVDITYSITRVVDIDE